MTLRHFTSLADVTDVHALVNLALALKAAPPVNTIGQGRSFVQLYFNPSLRTRLSSQRAAQLLGMDTTAMDVGSGWPIEWEHGAVMNQDKSEHIIEAAGVISQYADIIGVRSFPLLKDRDSDYSEPVLSAFKEYASRPIVNLESATGHPLQALTDMVTIKELCPGLHRPKVLLTWAPHPKALPQAVPNSFAQWSLAMGYDLTIAQPEGYELDPSLTTGAHIVYDPDEGYGHADIVYAKNWSSYTEYGKILSHDSRWTVDNRKMALTNEARLMHCLPVRRNVVIADEVLESPRSAVLQQAGNRTYAALAVLYLLLQGMGDTRPSS